MRILFITNASHTPSQSNYNHFQRVEFLSQNADLTLWVRKGADFSASAKPGTPTVKAAVGGKGGLFLNVLFYSLLGRARKFDIVLTEPSLLSIAGLICKIFGTKRWVVDVWDIPGRFGGHRDLLVRVWLRLNRYVLKQAFKFADLFLLSIRPDYDFEYYKIGPERMVRMKNAIHVSTFHRTLAPAGSRIPFNILCTRSIYHGDMGLDTLAAAYTHIRESGAPLTLTIVGTIPSTVQAQVLNLENDPSVEFPGFVEQQRLMEFIERAEVCVVPFKDVPDLAQTYPIKVIEYMAMGKPVIVSDIAGMREMVRDGENGVTFRAGNPLALAAAIEKVRTNPEFAARLCRNAARDSHSFDCVVKGRKILDALCDLHSR